MNATNSTPCDREAIFREADGAELARVAGGFTVNTWGIIWLVPPPPPPPPPSGFSQTYA
jgi:hypothetical protein